MGDIPDAVATLLEEAQIEGPVWPGSEVIEREEWAIWFGPAYYPGLVVVQRLRLIDIAAAVEEIRSLLRDRGYSSATWFVGSSATPQGLVASLTELGLALDVDDDPLLRGVVLDHAPDGVPEDVEVRVASTLADFEDFYRVQQEAFEVDPDRVEEGAKHVAELYAQDMAADFVRTYLACIDGAPVATARATFAEAGVVLNGGSTLHRARGRGVYRALVAARWNDAVEHGTPYLTTIARPTSYPILKRMGFVDVCTIDVMRDSF